jgi:hypothetical protein
MTTLVTFLAEYLADRNCWPELWIRNEDATPEQKKAFIEIATKAQPLVCNRDGAMFFVSKHGEDLGAGFSREAAFRSAAITLTSNLPVS